MGSQSEHPDALPSVAPNGVHDPMLECHRRLNNADVKLIQAIEAAADELTENPNFSPPPERQPDGSAGVGTADQGGR